MCDDWKIIASQKSFSSVIQQVKDIQEDHRRDGKISF